MRVLTFHQEYLAGLKVYLPVAALDTFPLVLRAHAVPPVLKLGAGLAQVLTNFSYKFSLSAVTILANSFSPLRRSNLAWNEALSMKQQDPPTR